MDTACKVGGGFEMRVGINLGATAQPNFLVERRTELLEEAVVRLRMKSKCGHGDEMLMGNCTVV